MCEETKVFYIFLGSILTFLGAWLVEYQKDLRKRKDRKQNFIIFIKQELGSIGKTLEKLKSALEYQRAYDRLLIDRLSKSISGLDFARRDAVYLESVTAQARLLDLLSDISIFLNEISSIEAFYFEQKKLLRQQTAAKDKGSGGVDLLFKTFKDLEDYFSRRRAEKLVELIDIKRRIEEFVKAINV